MNMEMNVEDPLELVYAAFYADCQHEVKRTQSGHRVTLVFNLLIEPEWAQMGPAAPDYTKEVDTIAAGLQFWCRKKNATNKLVLVLEHEYSEAGLSFGTLKNCDLAVADAPISASEKADFEVYASIVHISESHKALYVGDEYNLLGFMTAMTQSTTKTVDW